MTSPSMIETAGQHAESVLIDLDGAAGSFGELERHLARSSSPVRPRVAVDGVPGDTGQVLRGIRALLALCAFALVGILMCVIALVSEARREAPGGIARASTAVAVQLSVPGPDPAADYYAHVRFADGSERDVPIGAYLLDDPLSIEFRVQAAAESSTSCRIAVDGVRVVEQVAEAERTAVCRWSAP